MLLSATNPAILVGSRVQEADAVDGLVQLAERLGAPVISESGTTHGRLGFPCDHPLYAQGLPLWSPEVRERLNEFDVLFVAGMDLLRQYVYYEPARAIPEHIRLIHLDEDPYQLGKNYPLEVGLIGDTKTGLSELDAAVARKLKPAQTHAAQQRRQRYAAQHEAARQAAWKQCEAARSERPMSPLTFMESIARVLPPDAAVIEEAVTTTGTLLERIGALKNTSGYFGHRGWALGWGLGVAIGVKLAWPQRPVLAILGEGAALYGIQGLWSAAHHRVPVTFLIANNAQYQILKVGAAGMNLPQAKAGKFEGLDLVDPEVDLVQLAQSLGVEACRVSEPDELSDALRSSSGRRSPSTHRRSDFSRCATTTELRLTQTLNDERCTLNVKWGIDCLDLHHSSFIFSLISARPSSSAIALAPPGRRAIRFDPALLPLVGAPPHFDRRGSESNTAQPPWLANPCRPAHGKPAAVPRDRDR